MQQNARKHAEIVITRMQLFRRCYLTVKCRQISRNEYGNPLRQSYAGLSLKIKILLFNKRFIFIEFNLSCVIEFDSGGLLLSIEANHQILRDAVSTFMLFWEPRENFGWLGFECLTLFCLDILLTCNILMLLINFDILIKCE